MGKASATLGGKELILHGGEAVSWTLREGVLPSIGTFNIAPDDALALAKGKAPVSLVFTPDKGNPVTITNLWVTNILPGANPYISQVVVKDRRWFWQRGHVVGNYNIRRNVGVKRLLKNDQQLQVDFDRAFQIAYWRFSLLNQTVKYQPLTMVQDVLTKLSQIEKNYWGQAFEAVLDDRIGQKIQNIPIEDLRINDKGHEACMRAMAALPEAGITVDYDGKVIIFSRAAGDEIQIISALMPEVWGAGHTDLVKNNLIRPQAIDMLFTREVETRFDFLEQAAAITTTGTTTAQDNEPLKYKRQMANVISNPDYCTDGANGRPSLINGQFNMVQGTWIDVDSWFRALPALPVIGKRLDHNLCQRAFIPQMDLWSCLGLVGTFPDSETNLAPWMARISEIQNRYRRTFELNRLWTDQFLSFRAYRLATINPQTGQRGPSMAYGDYCLLPSQRSQYRSIARGKAMVYAMNKTGYPTSGDLGALDSTVFPSPGIVEVIDEDQGIINVNYAIDLNRTYEMVLPSNMESSSMPGCDLRNKTRPIAFNEIIDSSDPPRLSASYKLAVIITAIPASPNSAQQYHRIRVYPKDVADLLPQGAQAGLLEADGPIMEEYIGAGTEVARIRWSDDPEKVKLIEKIFGIDSANNAQVILPSDPDSQLDFSNSLSDLCLNIGPTKGGFGGSITDIAKAKAASIYASFVDRYEGRMTSYMNGGVHLSGWVNEITHEYTANAETYTIVSFPAEIPQMTLGSFLAASERAVIMKLAQP